MKEGVYLDFAAATPISPRVQEAMGPYFAVGFHNPSSEYRPGREAKVALNDARGLVASIIGSKSSEVIFTAGGTEANNLAVQGIMRRFPESNPRYSLVSPENNRAAFSYRREKDKENADEWNRTITS